MIGDCLFLSMFDKTNGRRFDVTFSNEITIASSPEARRITIGCYSYKLGQEGEIYFNLSELDVKASRS